MKLLKYIGYVVVVFALSVTLGCKSETKESGVVARVNGSPIFLKKLEYQSSLAGVNGKEEAVPSVPELKKQYGDLLEKLIVRELVSQELERTGLEVTEEEIKEEEAKIRSDYPEGAFEQILIEEYIDYSAWREELVARMSLEKFKALILRPLVSVSYEEADKYYKDHIVDFYLPPRIVFQLMTAPSRDLLGRAMELRNSGVVQGELKKMLKGVSVYHLKMREDRLSPVWAKHLDGLAAGEASPVFSDENGFQQLVLLEHEAGRVLEPSKAYPLVEQALLETKMTEEFRLWLTKTLEKSTISVSRHLLTSTSVVPQPVKERVQANSSM